MHSLPHQPYIDATIALFLNHVHNQTISTSTYYILKSVNELEMVLDAQKPQRAQRRRLTPADKHANLFLCCFIFAVGSVAAPSYSDSTSNIVENGYG